MLKRFYVTVPVSRGNKEKRLAYVYLPESYFKEPERRYPVLYMFDGHNVFLNSDATYGVSWGMKDYMDFTGTDIIVAAVECSHDPDNGRLKEYSPFTFDDPNFGLIQGRGKSTMNWFSNSFKRMIDNRYRTIPDRDHTFIAGSSMGGLMSLYALLQYNSVYSRAAALSPSLWTSPEKMAALIERVPLYPNTILYMDYGSEEFANHPSIKEDFIAISSMLMQRGVHLNCRIVPYGTHCEENWNKQLSFFMSTLLYEV